MTHDTLAHYGASLVSERMLMLPGEVQRCVEMFRLNGGKPIELPRRARAEVVGTAAAYREGGIDQREQPDPFLRVGRTAVISIDGPIFQAASFYSWMCGGLSVGEINRAVHAAHGDPDIDAVVLDMDCPGGQIAGVSDMIEAIDALAAEKTVLTFVHDRCASLAVWIAQHTHRIIASPSADYGSIGAMTLAYDTSAMYEKEGSRAVLVTEAKVKGMGRSGVPIDDEMIEAEMAVIRSMGRAFRADVTAKTGIDEDTLLGMQGAMHFAPEALALGLVDEIRPTAEFYSAVDAGEYSQYGPGEKNTTNTSGRSVAQTHEVRPMSAKLKKMMASLSDDERKQLAALAMEEDEESTASTDEDETMASEDEDEDETTAEDNTEDETDDETASDKEEKKDAKAKARKGGASAMTFPRARAILKPHKLPEAVANKIVISAVEKNQTEAQVLSSVIAEINNPANAANAELAAAAAGNTQPVGGGAGARSGNGGGDAKSKLAALARAKMQADPTLKQHEANREVLIEQPELGQQMRSEARVIRERRERASAHAMQS